MKQDKVGFLKLTFSRHSHTGHFLKEEPASLQEAARRFSCVFLSTSVTDAAALNHQLSAAGIRAYHAGDTREAEVLLAITSAKIVLIDIDRTFEPWPEILQKLDESHPNVPKIVLTARSQEVWFIILSLSHFVLDVVPKPAHLGELIRALECARSVELELNDPERARERETRVMAAIRSTVHPPRPVWHSIRMRLSAIMVKVTHAWCKSVWCKFDCHRIRRQHSHT
jgi:DNA-binding NarL/FixJ family response regulator